jgi:hypothetical protein
MKKKARSLPKQHSSVLDVGKCKTDTTADPHYDSFTFLIIETNMEPRKTLRHRETGYLRRWGRGVEGIEVPV